MVNWGSWLVWGFAATVVLTTLIAGSQGLGMTRMNMPHMLGTMFTANRDRAKSLGVLVHVINGWLFSLVYVVAFYYWGGPTWYKGAAIGLVHAAFVLTAAMPVLPGLHPRMASETRGPTVVRQLEPPGFLALHYGYQTPVSIIIGHVVFGIVLGTFYRIH
jgi:uncharacterized membrane protein YagU involved in acid resistance